jgi:hypothetical protein
VTFKSPHAYRGFAKSVKRGFRYVRTEEQRAFLDAVVATSAARAITMKAGFILWRAQLGHDWRTLDDVGEEVPTAYPPARMKPLPEKASDGRANTRGIPCLYLATDRDTAILEVRPLIGSYVSVARFSMSKEVRLIDCSRREIDPFSPLLDPDLPAEDSEKVVWTNINEAFSEPAERGDESVDYVPTQILAETFKSLGFDGIAYKSSYGESGFNVALFDPASADLINCGLYRVRDVSVKVNDEDTPYFVRRNT